MIALTGATGFVGQRIALALLDKQKSAVFLGRRAKPQSQIASNYYAADLSVQSIQEDWCKDVETLIHCAGTVSDWGSLDEMIQGNVALTENTLQSFPYLKKIIFISTSSVYDPFFTTGTYRETRPDPPHYLNAYAKTKRLAEKVVMRSHVSQKIILRPHAVYGVGDQKILPRLLESMRLGRFITIDHGRAPCTFTHVENLTAAVLNALEADVKGGEIFNIADEAILSVREVLTLICAYNNTPQKFWNIPKKLALPVSRLLETWYKIFRIKRPPLLTPYVVHQVADPCVLDVRKAKKYLGYAPQQTLKKSLPSILKSLE